MHHQTALLRFPRTALMAAVALSIALVAAGQFALMNGAMWGFSLQMMAAGQLLLLALLVGFSRPCRRHGVALASQDHAPRWLPKSAVRWAPWVWAALDVVAVFGVVLASWLCVLLADRSHSEAEFHRYKAYASAIEGFLPAEGEVVERGADVDGCAFKSHSPELARACLLNAKAEEWGYGSATYVLSQATLASPESSKPMSDEERALAYALVRKHLAMPEMDRALGQFVASFRVHLHNAFASDALERSLETPLLRFAAQDGAKASPRSGNVQSK